MKTRLRPL